jgi:hypothetical protein
LGGSSEAILAHLPGADFFRQTDVAHRSGRSSIGWPIAVIIYCSEYPVDTILSTFRLAD